MLPKSVARPALTSGVLLANLGSKSAPPHLRNLFGLVPCRYTAPSTHCGRRLQHTKKFLGHPHRPRILLRCIPHVARCMDHPLSRLAPPPALTLPGTVLVQDVQDLVEPVDSARLRALPAEGYPRAIRGCRSHRYVSLSITYPSSRANHALLMAKRAVHPRPRSHSATPRCSWGSEGSRSVPGGYAYEHLLIVHLRKVSWEASSRRASARKTQP